MVEPQNEQAPNPEPRPFWLRAAGYGAGLLVGTVVGAGFATDVMPDHIDVGPIEANVRVLPSNVIDGTLVGKKTLHGRQESPVFFGLVGAHLTVTDLAAEVPDGKSQGADNQAVVSEFAQLFTNIDHDKSLAVAKIERRLSEGAAGGLVAALVLELGIPYYSRRLKSHHPSVAKAWSEIYHHYSPGIRRTALAATGATLAAAGIFVGYQETQDVHPTAAFANIPALKNLELSGSLASDVISVFKFVDNSVTTNKVFYHGIVESEDTEFKALGYAEQLPVGDHIFPILLDTDRHCNVGMDPVLAEEAKLYHVKLAISGGDDDFSGTLPFEFACTSELATYFKSLGIAEVNELGNHDSSPDTDPSQGFSTEGWEQSEGIKVLDGKPLVIKLADGNTLTLLGSRDPRRSRIGHAIVTVNPDLSQTEAVTEQGQQIGEVACESQAPIDIAVVHDPLAGEIAVEDGCGKVNFEFSGHLHRRIGPLAMGFNENGQPVFRFVGGTSGGAKEDTPTFGPLQMPATSDILYWDAEAHQPIGMVHNLSLPDGTMVLGNYEPFQTSALPARQSASKLKSHRQAHVHHHKSRQIAQRPGRVVGRRD